MSAKSQPQKTRSRHGGGGPGRRVTQETIDEMAALRRQGLTFEEIGVRVGRSERTARRYTGKVQPQLHLPQEEPGLDTDPRALRAQLISEFLEVLYNDRRLRSLTFTWQRVDDNTQQAVYGGPPSILFLSEAERLIREQLESLNPHALRFLALDKRSKHRFLREVVGSLYSDYVAWHRFSQSFDGTGTGEDWRPPRERPPVEPIDEDECTPSKTRQAV